MNITTKIITRKDYMDGTCSHQEYYAQFVTPAIKERVLDIITLKSLLASRDEHFNDIQLHRWDKIKVTADIEKSLKVAEDFATLAVMACISKEAARQIIQQGAGK